jgi:hypothetical protein
MSKLDDIDYLINLVYEHLYNKIPSRPIDSKPLSTNYLEDLTIVKKMYEGKQLDELINVIFNTNISYSGKSESAYIFKRVDQKSDILLRQYPKDQVMNPSTPLNVDKIVAYLLSDLVIHKKTTGIMLNICNVDIPAKELQLFTKKYPEIKLDGTVSVTIREHFYKLVTLKEHLKKDNTFKNYQDCIFQVLHTLSVIQSMYPTFRHNNLTIDNILVYETTKKNLKFKINNTEFIFKSSGKIKITNFLKSNIKDYITNDSLDPVMQKPNIYYDTDMFLESLLELELPSSNIANFIKKYHNKEISAREILSSDFFKEYKNVEDDQLGGRSKISKGKSSKSSSSSSSSSSSTSRTSSRTSSRKSSRSSRRNKKTKINKKYNMSQDEVDEILNVETPVEDTIKYLEKNKNKVNNSVNDIFNDLKSKPYVTSYNNESIINKMPQKPISLPELGLEVTKAETANPIIQVNLPQPVIPPSGIANLLGTPDSPSGGIANGFGASQPITNFNIESGSIADKLKGQVPEFNAPLNVLPNPYKENTSKLHSLFGNIEQNGGSRLNLKGGSDRVIPIYKNIKNSPYIPNEAKRIKQERFFEANPDAARETQPQAQQQQQQPYLQHQTNLSETKTAFSLNIAPELLPPARRPLPPAPPENVVKMMNYIIPNSFGNQTYSIPPQFAQPSANVMSQNTYNISFANPSQVREFREDILPSKDESMLKYSMSTISERVVIYQYIRSILIRHSDGENINFLSDKSPEVRNLLSYLRILDLDVTKYDKTKNNQSGIVIPRRLIIYRSCYPIRVDRVNYNVGCAKNNIGISIRIYQMILGETFVNKYKSLPYNAFEVWRDISFYENVRDNIVKANISPNFTMLYAYYITQDTQIDFLKVNRLRNKDIINKQEKQRKFVLNNLYKKEMQEYLIGLQKYSTSDLTKLVDQLDIHTPSNKCLIALTESGTQDLISWGSRQYEDNGLAKKMINTGYHSYEVWLSILFQMYHSFLCMYKCGISFHNFDLNGNVLIKSLKQDEMNKGYWKYRLNNIDFYIPNYGYMVMINSDFADIYSNDEQTLENQLIGRVDAGLPIHVYGLGAAPPAPAEIILAIADSTPRKIDKIAYKVYSDELLVNKTDVNMCINKIRTLINMKDAFDPNKFNKEFTLNGGVRPDDSIMKIITDIHSEILVVLEKEKKVVDTAQDAEAAAIAANIKDDDAISRVVEAAVEAYIVVRDTPNGGNAKQISENARTAQINLEKLKEETNLLRDNIDKYRILYDNAGEAVNEYNAAAAAGAAPAAGAAGEIIAKTTSALQILRETYISVLNTTVQPYRRYIEVNRDVRTISGTGNLNIRALERANYVFAEIPQIPGLGLQLQVQAAAIAAVPAVPNPVEAAALAAAIAAVPAADPASVAAITAAVAAIPAIAAPLAAIPAALQQLQPNPQAALPNPTFPRLTIKIDDLINKTLIKKFKEFLHNRVGTSLKEGERMNLIQNTSYDVGQLVCNIQNNRWGIITKKEVNTMGTPQYNIMTYNQPSGNDNNITSKLDIGVGIVNGHLRVSNTTLEQISKPNQNLSDNNLLETYDLILSE